MFGGVIVPILTFFDKKGGIDFEAQRRQTDFIVNAGVDAVFIMGSAGEGVALRDAEKVRLAEKSAEMIKGRARLIAGVSQESAWRVKELMSAFKELPLDAIVVTLPYYFPVSSQEAVKQFFLEIADASPKPVFVYNIPCFTKVNIAPETTLSLTSHPNIIGVKDSNPDLAHTLKLIRLIRERTQDFKIFVGEEAVVASLAEEQFDGIIPIYGNIFPDVVVRLFRAVKEKNYPEIVKMQAKLNEGKLLLYCADSFFAALKGYVSLRKTGQPFVHPPMRTATPAQLAEIKKLYDKLEPAALKA
jgi:4-hydroxy-tetrahydrodipicolinate synthase